MSMLMMIVVRKGFGIVDADVMMTMMMLLSVLLMIG